MSNGIIYHCSNGRFYGDVDLWKNFEAGRWKPVCWDEESGQEWIEDDSGELLVLEPISAAESPEWIEFEETKSGIRLDPPLPVNHP